MLKKKKKSTTTTKKQNTKKTGAPSVDLDSIKDMVDSIDNTLEEVADKKRAQEYKGCGCW